MDLSQTILFTNDFDILTREVVHVHFARKTMQILLLLQYFQSSRIPLARDEIEFIDEGKKVQLLGDTNRELDNFARRQEHEASSTIDSQKIKVDKKKHIRPTTAVQGIN